jgi:hypothetical protein
MISWVKLKKATKPIIKSLVNIRILFTSILSGNGWRAKERNGKRRCQVSGGVAGSTKIQLNKEIAQRTGKSW